MRLKGMVCLILVLLLGLSGCGGQALQTPTTEAAQPTTEPAVTEKPEVQSMEFEYAGLVLTLDSSFRQGQIDPLWKMHFESDALTVTVSHCQYDNISSDSRAGMLRYDLEAQWATVTEETGEDGFTYLVCRNEEEAYVCGQLDYGDLSWLVEVTSQGAAADVDAMVKILNDCHPAEGSLQIKQEQRISLGGVNLRVDASFRQVTDREKHACWLGAPYVLTVKRYEPMDPHITTAELASQAIAYEAITREHTTHHDWNGVHCMTALGGSEPNIATAYYLVDGYCHEVTLTGFEADEEDAVVALIAGCQTQQPEQAEKEIHTVTVDHKDFSDLCCYIEDSLLMDEWESYTVTVTGLCTDVVLHMEYLNVVAAEAYGRTLEVNIGADEGLVDANVNQYEDMILLTSSYNSWIIGPDWEYTFPEDDSVCTYLYVDEAGQLVYWQHGGYTYYSEQWATGLLDSVSDRGALYSEEGTVTVEDRKPILHVTHRKTVSDVCDLDAIFAAAKALGWADYDAFDSADDVLADNKAGGIAHPIYPVTPEEPVQTEQFRGLTLNLTEEFEADTTSADILKLSNETATVTVTTGLLAEGYGDLEGPVTAGQLSEYELQQQTEGGIADYKGLACVVGYGRAVVFYTNDSQWWRVEATGYYEPDLITHAGSATVN